MIKEGVLVKAKDHYLKDIMRRSLHAFVKQLRKIASPKWGTQYIEMATWMSYSVDEYF